MEVEGEWLDGKPHGICIFNIEKEGYRGVMIFTNGNPVEAPCWVENKEDKSRASFETFFGLGDKGGKGITRMYNNDEEEIIVKSTKQKKKAPGWLRKIDEFKGKEGFHSKGFNPYNGMI